MRNKEGFTLLELIIILALIATVLLIAFPPAILSYDNFNMQTEKSYIVSDARTAMDYLTRQIRKSNNVEIEDNIITIDSSTYKLKDTILYKDDVKIMEGIDDLIANKFGKRIDITIVIKDSKDNNYQLLSTFYIR